MTSPECGRVGEKLVTIREPKTTDHSAYSGVKSNLVSINLSSEKVCYCNFERKNRFSSWLASILLSGTLSFVSGGLAPVKAGDREEMFLVSQHSTPAPAGFSGVCRKYSWACEQSVGVRVNTRANLLLAMTVNRQVNQQTRQIEDRDQYGKDEYWALPTARGGDCEDIALLKKKMLLDQGVPTENLLISTVLDRNLSNHAVLIFRTNNGDLVLDSLTNKIVPWRKTGYTFLKMQNPQALGVWQAVLAGGVIKSGAKASW